MEQVLSVYAQRVAQRRRKQGSVGEDRADLRRHLPVRGRTVPLGRCFGWVPDADG